MFEVAKENQPQISDLITLGTSTAPIAQSILFTRFKSNIDASKEALIIKKSTLETKKRKGQIYIIRNGKYRVYSIVVKRCHFDEIYWDDVIKG